MEQNENRTIKKEQEQNDLAVDPRSRTERNNFKKVGTCPGLLAHFHAYKKQWRFSQK